MVADLVDLLTINRAIADACEHAIAETLALPD
jgi:hypothetical protein